MEEEGEEMRRKRGKRDSELYQEGNFSFRGQPTLSFEEAFPSIEDVMIEVREFGSGPFGQAAKVTYRKGQFGNIIDCKKYECTAGGFDISQILDDMVRENKTKLETTKFCKGYEATPTRRRRASCDHYFKIKVDITYRESGEEPE